MPRSAAASPHGEPSPTLGGAQGFSERSVLAARRRTGGWSGLVASLVAHTAVFGGALLYAVFTPPRVVPEKPIVAKLVRLGKPRDEKLLPRLPAAPPPPAAQPAPAAPEPAPAPPSESAKPAPAPVAAPVPAPATTATPAMAEPEKPAPRTSSEALDRQQRMMDALARLGPAPEPGPHGKKAEERPGQLDGDPLGNAEEAAEGDAYAAKVQQLLKGNFVLPNTISQKEKLFLTIKLRLFVLPTGKIDRHVVDAPSGNAEYDRAVERTLLLTTLPPPPAAFLARYGKSGLGFEFRP